jgi:hypothetical protein
LIIITITTLYICNQLQLQLLSERQVINYNYYYQSKSNQLQLDYISAPMQNNNENFINADCSNDKLEGCMVSRRARASSAAIYFCLAAESRVFGPDFVNARDYDGLMTTLLTSIHME